MVIDILHPGKATIPKTENSEKKPKYVRPHQMLSLYLDSEPTLVVARPLALAWLMISKKNEPKHTLARHGLYDKTMTSRKEQKEHKNRLKKDKGTAKANVGAGPKWAGDWIKEGVNMLQWLNLQWLCQFFMRALIK